jgi:hypothetical protein
MRQPEGSTAIVPTDMRGTQIKPGRPVAYNLSGTVAKGEVEEVQAFRLPNAWGSITASIKVRLEHDANGYRKGHLSTVRHPNNVLVLFGEDGA